MMNFFRAAKNFLIYVGNSLINYIKKDPDKIAKAKEMIKNDDVSKKIFGKK